MCLAVPMKVVEIAGDMGTARSGGLKRAVNLSLMKGLRIGDYVLVHAGFAIEKVNEVEAHKTLQVLKEVKNEEMRGRFTSP